MDIKKPWWMKDFNCLSRKGVHKLTITPHWWAYPLIFCVFWTGWFTRYVWAWVDNRTGFGCISRHEDNGDELIGPTIGRCKQ